MIILCVVMGLLAALTPFTLILTLPMLVACVIPLSLFSPIYLFENIGIWEAFKKTYRLGFATWGGVFLIALIMGLIGGILQGITSAVTISPVYNFFLYLMGILQAFGMYLSTIFTIIGLAYQYGHASEVVDSVSVEEDIDNFDNL